jgi:adenylate cyclase
VKHAAARLFQRRWRRMLWALVPLTIGVLHACGLAPLQLLERLEHLAYDVRLRLSLPRTADERIVIVDIDESSLERVGRWPWSRDKMAAFTTELFERQGALVVGFDLVFAEADDSSGLKSLQQLAQGPLKSDARFAGEVDRLTPTLDFDARFASALDTQNAVLGYYFTSDRDATGRGVLPAPVLTPEQLGSVELRATEWNGFGSNIGVLARAAPGAGFFNAMADADGVVRSLPLLAKYQERYYESLALAVYRSFLGGADLVPVFASAAADAGERRILRGVELRHAGGRAFVPVDDQLAVLVPYRGAGGPTGGSFRYVPAADVLTGQLAAGSLRGKAVLVGTTAPGLQDLRATPVGRAYPGVETHASVLSGFLDGKAVYRPDYAPAFDVVQIVLAGLLLAFALPLLSAGQALLLAGAVFVALVALNAWLYLALGLALPLAAALVVVLLATALDMAYGYITEGRTKRGLAQLFGTYVPPELVGEMLLAPERYSMQAASRELTVMFCDMRGFTAMSERMEPVQLQALLNDIFSRLTQAIRAQRGTIDKYMGDCVMAFWGAPVPTPDHAALAVRAALDMVAAVDALNAQHRARGLPEIGIGIGLNTGPMCVGDMGSDVRRSYTVIGDAVNLGSRLEGLCKVYGVEIVASEATRLQAPGFVWQELDRVRVKGKEDAVAIFCPLGEPGALTQDQKSQLDQWHQALASLRAQDWPACEARLARLRAAAPGNPLFAWYAERLAQLRVVPYQPDWDGATRFDTK